MDTTLNINLVYIKLSRIYGKIQKRNKGTVLTVVRGVL